MRVRCPACNASMSLEVLITHDDAREALIALTGISDDMYKAILKYLTLFRPSERDLSFKKVSRLLGELIPMIQVEEIKRNGKTYPAPRAAWLWAANRCLEARDMGKLKPPLTSHGFLLENITFWQPEKTAMQAVSPTVLSDNPPQSKLRDGVGNLMEWANGDGK